MTIAISNPITTSDLAISTAVVTKSIFRPFFCITAWHQLPVSLEDLVQSR